MPSVFQIRVVITCVSYYLNCSCSEIALKILFQIAERFRSY